MPENDAIYLIKKNIGHAKFFLKPDKKEQARDKLKKSMDILNVAQRGITNKDNIRALMGLLEEISTLSKRTE